MPLQVKTSDLDTTATPRAAYPRKHTPGSEGIPYAGIRTIGDKDTPGLNRNAWVVLPCWSHSICNDRDKFISYDELIEPIPLHCELGRTAASVVGIGEVRLHLRLRSGQTTECVLANVLHAPGAALNLVTCLNMGDMAGVGACTDEDAWCLTLDYGARGNGSELRRKDGNQAAWFPTERKTEAGLCVLRQRGVFDRLWRPPYLPRDSRPRLMLTSWVEKNPWDLLMPVVGGKMLMAEMRKLVTETGSGAEKAATARFRCKPVIGMDGDERIETIKEWMQWALTYELTGRDKMSPTRYTPSSISPELLSSMHSHKAQSSVYPWEILRIESKNRDAWVHIPCGQGRFSICHDRKDFITYDQFTEPIPIQNDLGASGLCAIGIGEVRLRVRKSNNEVEECTLETVLHVPKAAANLICPRSLSNVCDGFTFPTSGPQEYAVLNDEYGHEKICFRKSIGRHLEAHWVLNQDGQDGIFWRRKNITARSYPLLRLDCWIDKDPFDFLNPLDGKKNKAGSHPNGRISHNTEPGSSSTAAATSISADPQHPGSKRKGTKKRKSKKRKSKKRSPEAGPPVEIIGPSLHDFQLEVKGGSQWSKYRFIKVNWWSRPRFQAHYGLSMSPKDLEEGNEILDEYKTFGYFS